MLQRKFVNEGDLILAQEIYPHIWFSFCQMQCLKQSVFKIINMSIYGVILFKVRLDLGI